MWLERTRTAAIVVLIFVALETIAFAVVFNGPTYAYEVPPKVIETTPPASNWLAVGGEFGLLQIVQPTFEDTL